MSDDHHHPMESTLPEPLPDGWHLENDRHGRYYAQHPDIGRTGRFDEDALDSVVAQAHQMHDRAGTDDPSADAPPDDATDDVEARHGASPNDADPAPKDDALAPTPGDDAPAPPAEVYDEENDRFVEIPPEEADYAQTLHEWLQTSTLITGLVLKAIRDEEAYLALGCRSFKEYCDTQAPMARKTAYRHISRVERFADFLPDAFSPEAVSRRHTNPLQALKTGPSEGDAEGEAPIPPALNGLSNGKLDALGDLGDDRLRAFVEGKEFTTASGKTITRAEIDEMTAKEVSRQVAEVLQPHKDKAEAEKERRLKAEAERDALAEELDEKQEKIEAAEALEDTWGPPAARLEDKRAKMERLEEHLREATKLVQKIGVTPEDPTPDQDRAADIAAHCERLGYVAQDELHEVLLSPDRTGEL